MKFPKTDCLALVDCELVARSEIANIPEALDSKKSGLFLTGSSVLGEKEELLLPGIMKDHHHRSAQLPNETRKHLTDNYGNIYSTLRLKGNGLFSAPDGEKFINEKGKVRNLNKDETGYIRGLQALHEIQTSMEHAKKLLEMGIQTEIPLAAYKLNEVILQTKTGVWERMNFSDAMDFCDLPAEYKEIPFAIRVDAMGVNNRLQDFIKPDNIFFGKGFSNEQTRELFLDDTWKYLLEEQKRGLIDLNITNEKSQENILKVLNFTTKRIFENLAKVHKNQGVHGRMTPDNMTLDGKFVDYDTLKWLTKGTELNEGIAKDVDWTKTALTDYGNALLDYSNISQDINPIIEASLKHYQSILYKSA
jgi:hypothetical protein